MAGSLPQADMSSGGLAPHHWAIPGTNSTRSARHWLARSAAKPLSHSRAWTPASRLRENTNTRKKCCSWEWQGPVQGPRPLQKQAATGTLLPGSSSGKGRS